MVGGIVVAGGGLAGAAAATRLARAGRRPLLLERTTGPHDKICGDFVSTEAQAHLAALGFDAGRLGGAPIDRVRLVDGDRVAEAKLPFTALGLTRRRLDATLLDHAAASGVGVERGVTVRQVGATLATSGGDLTPAALLLATGKAEVRGAKRATAGTLDHLIGFKQYYRVPPATLAALAGVIEIVLFDGGYAGVQRVEDGLVNLCLLVDRRRFDASGGDVLGGLLAGEPRLARLLGQATPQLARPLTISGVPYGFVHRGGAADAAGAFRLGDQVGVIPSFTGDGMAIALHSAGLAAAAVLAGASPAAYHAAFRRDCARQIGRATALQRFGEGRFGQRLVIAGFGALPALLRWAAALTRVSPAALARAGLAA